MTSGKRIELAVVGDSLSNFLQSQAGQEAVVHFKVHPDDIAMLTKEGDRYSNNWKDWKL
jgi:hypothetical protein